MNTSRYSFAFRHHDHIRQVKAPIGVLVFLVCLVYYSNTLPVVNSMPPSKNTTSSKIPTTLPGEPLIDLTADKVLKECSRRIQGLRSFAVEIVNDSGYEGEGLSQHAHSLHTLAFRRPSHFALICREGSLGSTIICDGKEAYVKGVMADKPETVDFPIGGRLESLIFVYGVSEGMGSGCLVNELLTILLAKDPYEQLAGTTGPRQRYLGVTKFAGVDCHKIKVPFTIKDGEGYFFIDAGDGRLIRGAQSQAQSQVNGRTISFENTILLKKWKMNPELPDKTFSIPPLK